MKKLFALLAISAIIMACGNVAPKRIVSETPVQTEIAGLTLCSEMTPIKIEKAFEHYIGGLVHSQKENYQKGKVVRLMPYSHAFNFAGFTWTYADVTIDKDSKIVSISMVASYEEYKSVEPMYESLQQNLTAKYGKANDVDLIEDVVGECCFWTDDTNSISLIKEESSSITGAVRSFCSLQYINIALSDAMEAEDNEL